jgi:hypothetical protein
LILLNSVEVQQQSNDEDTVVYFLNRKGMLTIAKLESSLIIIKDRGLVEHLMEQTST